ncbi:uncharacterized protein LOC101858447 [Aplysia californica]|uniref:Uncharacterized protein LOC101858447 n=1 Tax=Aplysia californica TaxID=6500 RepID=A0ABM1W245_APLCA|nr:uncharacterized protein LOC101858447 [Aplysia californica]
MLTKSLFLAAMLCVCQAHLCLISPPQRGSMMNLNTKGSSDCILLKSPCGGREMREHGIALTAGERFAVTFQKNLDHFNANKPGYFSISIGHGNETMHELFHTADTSAPSLSLYSTNITIPHMEGPTILQARYVTNNDQAPAVFYQCSDVRVVPRRPPQAVIKP